MCVCVCVRIQVCVCYGLCVQSVTVRSAEDERKDRSCVCHRHWITLSPCSPTTVRGSCLVRSPRETEEEAENHQTRANMWPQIYTYTLKSFNMWC